MKPINEHLDIDDFDNLLANLSEIEKIPREDNILVELTENDIILKNKYGEIMLLSSLLPRNCFLEYNTDFAYASYIGIQRSVKYPISAIDKAHFFLYLLHEIGHAQDKIFHRDQEVMYNQMRTTIGQDAMLLSYFTENIKERVVRLITGKTEKYSSNKNLTKTKRQERFAWNFALRKYRELKNEWWDLSGWLTDEQVSDIVRYALLSYEINNIDKYPWEKYVTMTNRKRWKSK